MGNMKKIIALLICLVMVFTANTFAFAEETGIGLADGEYKIGVITDSVGAGRMFKINREDNNSCNAVVKDGKIVATIRLNAQGYDKLYLGKATAAAKASEEDWINAVIDEDGKYTFEIPFDSFDKVIDLAAYGTAGKAWHDHNIIFYSSVPPQERTVSQVVSSSHETTVKWNAATEDIYGYQIQYSTDPEFSFSSLVTVEGKEKTSHKFPDNTYYYRVRTISTKSGGLKSQWSEVLSPMKNPSKPVISSVTAVTKAATVKWGKKSNATGYEVQYSTSSTFAKSKTKTVVIKDNATVSKKVKSLTSGKKYYFRVRSVSETKEGKAYSSWSAKKYVTVK